MWARKAWQILQSNFSSEEIDEMTRTNHLGSPGNPSGGSQTFDPTPGTTSTTGDANASAVTNAKAPVVDLCYYDLNGNLKLLMPSGVSEAKKQTAAELEAAHSKILDDRLAELKAQSELQSTNAVAEAKKGTENQLRLQFPQELNIKLTEQKKKQEEVFNRSWTCPGGCMLASTDPGTEVTKFAAECKETMKGIDETMSPSFSATDREDILMKSLLRRKSSLRRCNQRIQGVMQLRPN
ncbi:hypothetical protein IFR05_009988 [Cadophora sp. M221]|nr:hypothetical protein IFR05_009988 [Cadophora sp. M221]